MRCVLPSLRQPVDPEQVPFMKARLGAAVAALLLVAAAPAASRPIAYAGATTVMFDAGADRREALVFHAPRYWYSLGAGWQRHRSDDPTQTREVSFVRANLLARRWNLPSAQANAFVWGSVGSARGGGARGTGANAGFQIDYETLDFYSMLKSEWWTSSAWSYRSDTAQLGFAPYRHRYGGWATWLVGMVENNAGALSGTPEYSLLARFFNEKAWIEAGVNDRGDPRLMLMFNF